MNQPLAYRLTPSGPWAHAAELPESMGDDRKGSFAGGKFTKRYTKMEICDKMNALNTCIQMRYLMATSIRLDPILEQRLNHLAAETGRTKAYYLRELVANGLDDLEDYYLAAATMERVRKGKEKIYSEAEIRKEFGLDN